MSETGMVRIDIQPLEAGLIALKQTAETIVVKDAPTCLAAKTAQRDVRNYMKDVHQKIDPFVESAKRNLQVARDELNKWLIPAETIDAALAFKVKDFERREREAAEAETRRINEERRIEAARLAEIDRKAREAEADRQRKIREKELEEQRKAGELSKRELEKAKKLEAEIAEREKERARQDEIIAAANVVEVKVEPNIPKVAGVPSRTNYKFRIIDASRIPRQYLMPNDVKIGADVREWKKEGEVIPGIEAYRE
jgi:hypothetical protein